MMYAFVDQPVESLSNSGRFLLWAMRGWTRAAEQKICPPRALHRGFAAMNARAALPDFHAAMALLAGDACARLHLFPMACPCIAEDEAILIALWRDAAAGRDAAMAATLSLLVAPGSAGPVANAMRAATAGLAAAGFAMPPALSPTRKHQEN